MKLEEERGCLNGKRFIEITHMLSLPEDFRNEDHSLARILSGSPVYRERARARRESRAAPVGGVASSSGAADGSGGGAAEHLVKP